MSSSRQSKSAVGRVATVPDAGQIIKSTAASEAHRRRVMKRVEAYRKALEQLGVDKEVSSLTSGSSSSSSKGSGKHKSRKGKSKKKSVAAITIVDDEEDTVAPKQKPVKTTSSLPKITKQPSMQEMEIPQFRTRQSFSLIRENSNEKVEAPTSSLKWTRISQSLDPEEAATLRYKSKSRRPLTTKMIARDSVEVALEQKERAATAKNSKSGRAVQVDTVSSKATAEQLKVATRKSLDLVRFSDFDLSLLRNTTHAPVVTSDSLSTADEPALHHSQENSQDWEDPMLEEGFDLNTLQFANGGVFDAQEEDDEEFGGIVPLEAMESLQDDENDAKCEWDEWWDWYQEAAAYTDSMEQLAQIDVPVSVCYVTHINSYLLEDQEMPTMIWQANEQVDADKRKSANRMSSGSSTSASTNSSSSSKNSILKRNSSKGSGSKQVRFADAPLSVGYTIAYEDDDNSSLDSMDDVMRFYTTIQDDENPRYGYSSICIESSDEESSEGETDDDTSGDENSDSEYESSDSEGESDEWTDGEDIIRVGNKEDDSECVDESLIMSMFNRDGSNTSLKSRSASIQKQNSAERLAAEKANMGGFSDSDDDSDDEDDTQMSAHAKNNASLESLEIRGDESSNNSVADDIDMDSVFGDLNMEDELDMSQLMASGNPLFGTTDDDEEDPEILALEGKLGRAMRGGGQRRKSTIGKFMSGVMRRMSRSSSKR